MALPIVEIGNVPVIFADACVQIERVGSCFTLVFAAPQMPLDGELATAEHVVRVRLVMPAESVERLRRQLETIEQSAVDTAPRAELRAVN